MGWAGPAQPTGPDSAQNCWADLGPKDSSGPDPAQKTGGPAHPTGPDSVQNCWADFGPQWIGPSSAQNKNSSGPDPAQKTRLGQDPPGPATKTGGGNYSPPAPACRTLIVLHAVKKKK